MQAQPHLASFVTIPFNFILTEVGDKCLQLPHQGKGPNCQVLCGKTVSTGQASAASKWCSHLRRGLTLCSVFSQLGFSGSFWQGRQGSRTSSKAGRRPAEGPCTTAMSHITPGALSPELLPLQCFQGLAKSLDRSARLWQGR